jgi:Predicted ATPase involved in cell division
VPADGVQPILPDGGPNRPISTAEPNVTIAPAPRQARSIRSRVLGRSRDQAKQERAVVVLHDVTKEYPNGKLALREVDLVIPEGDFVFLVGPSGPASPP